jgi:prepilin-type N-terminal cleavage/methylation domain-containing protein
MRRGRAISAARQARSESGFTLIELLTVMLVIAIIASVGISTLLTQRFKGGDAVAKEMAHTAQQTAMTYGLTNPGDTGMTPAALNAQEPSLNIVANGKTLLAAAAPTPTGYSLGIVSSTADTFYLTYSNGIVSRTCTVAAGNGNTGTNTGGGCNNGKW